MTECDWCLRKLEKIDQLMKENAYLRRSLKIKGRGADESLRAERRNLKASLSRSISARLRLLSQIREIGYTIKTLRMLLARIENTSDIGKKNLSFRRIQRIVENLQKKIVKTKGIKGLTFGCNQIHTSLVKKKPGNPGFAKEE